VQITLEAKNVEPVQQALNTIAKSARFATAKALNRTANDVQTAIRDGLASAFQIRRAVFVQRTIYRDRATDFAGKAQLKAAVRVDPRRDFLAQHEEGGRKTPRAGRTVAIPLPAVQPDRALVVPRRLRPSQLKGDVRRVTTPAGDFLVRNRPGRGGGGRAGWRTEFLYRLKASVPLRPRLKFHETAQKTLDARWVPNAIEQVDAILAAQAVPSATG
jgi:hypothetical protein